MPKDPGSLFGNLLSVCIRDEYAKEPKVLVQGVLLLLLGACSSVVTTYVLTLAGILL